eukprot:CAMPEP_0174719324 /NCGR_PEP_ID=MMETSP1094-20130205/30911_1 /TAXON_ID=156173 /ORGANISM="Chrysochromulina brevifilum, Strain UTEX LB 985" /LENGTH=109 /DNA_ID=CAMNT_0015919601 /DNA_START=570 /DNA_END=900 /DNA_ORIENTATION=+
MCPLCMAGLQRHQIDNSGLADRIRKHSALVAAGSSQLGSQHMHDAGGTRKGPRSARTRLHTAGQTIGAEAPRRQYAPGSQDLQPVLALSPWYVPAGHLEHIAAPACALK